MVDELVVVVIIWWGSPASCIIMQSPTVTMPWVPNCSAAVRESHPQELRLLCTDPEGRWGTGALPACSCTTAQRQVLQDFSNVPLRLTSNSQHPNPCHPSPHSAHVSKSPREADPRAMWVALVGQGGTWHWVGRVLLFQCHEAHVAVPNHFIASSKSWFLDWTEISCKSAVFQQIYRDITAKQSTVDSVMNKKNKLKTLTQPQKWNFSYYSFTYKKWFISFSCRQTTICHPKIQGQWAGKEQGK